MPKPGEPVVMYDSPEAATLRTVTGWVSRRGHFYGDNEHAARFDGCTHRKCSECEAVVPIHGIPVCDNCRDEKRVARFFRLPSEPYDGEPCSLHDGEEFFSDQDAIVDYSQQNEIPYADLRLLKCAPRYAGEVDPEDIYGDLLPEGGDLPNYIVEAFATLNRTLRETKGRQPICWMPVDVRIVLPEGFPVYVSATTGEVVSTPNCPLVTGMRPCMCDGLPRCPECNYTDHDARFELDHSACRGTIPAATGGAE